MVTDPVCKMQIEESKAAGKSEYQGKTYYFCAQSCKTKFDANPQQYAKGEGSGNVNGLTMLDGTAPRVASERAVLCVPNTSTKGAGMTYDV